MTLVSPRQSAAARAFALGLVTLVLAALPATAADRLRVGLLEFGTVSWLVETMRAERLDATRDLAVETTSFASNDAARIAFQTGAVDVIVSDLVFAGRRRAEGRATVFQPQSASEGAIVVAEASPIRTLADLSGRKIGVAGGALDKSWLILQAEAKRRHGIDLARTAEPVFGAPPMLARKLETGELDAALLYWTQSTRLEAKGFRRLASVGELARGFGTKGDVALVGWLFHGEDVAARPAVYDRFVAAVEATATRMEDPAVWPRIRPLMRAEDDATFEALRRTFLAGRPKRPIAEEEADARILWAALAAAGGPELVGKAVELPAGLYRTHGDGRP